MRSDQRRPDHLSDPNSLAVIPYDEALGTLDEPMVFELDLSALGSGHRAETV